MHDSNVEDEDSTLNDSWTEYTESTVEDDVIHAGKEVDLDAVSEHRVNGVGHLEDGELEAGPRTIFQEEGEVRGPSKVAKVEEGTWDVVGQRRSVCNRSARVTQRLKWHRWVTTRRTGSRIAGPHLVFT